MASIFRRIYDWLLRLFWCVLPSVMFLLAAVFAARMRHLPRPTESLPFEQHDGPDDTHMEC
jgi:uncharacterized membrane protein